MRSPARAYSCCALQSGCQLAGVVNQSPSLRQRSPQITCATREHCRNMIEMQWAGGCPGFELCKTVTVRPSSKPALSTVPLPPADFGARQRVYYEQSFCFIVPGLLDHQQLQQALQKLVDAFPVIAGRYELVFLWAVYAAGRVQRNGVSYRLILSAPARIVLDVSDVGVPLSWAKWEGGRAADFEDISSHSCLSPAAAGSDEGYLPPPPWEHPAQVCRLALTFHQRQ